MSRDRSNEAGPLSPAEHLAREIFTRAVTDPHTLNQAIEMVYAGAGDGGASVKDAVEHLAKNSFHAAITFFEQLEVSRRSDG